MNTVIHKKTWQCICDHNSGRSWWILIIFTYLETRMQVIYLLIYFACDVNIRSVSRSRHWWAVTASAECVARLGAVADWWRSWPMANTLAYLCSCHWWTFWHAEGIHSRLQTFWTYLVTVNLFSLNLMNFMFHTTLDAVGSTLRVHYRSMKFDVSFSQGSVSTLFMWGKHVFIYV